MSRAPWNPVPGWDVPRDYYAPDEPTADEESFDEMAEERLSMQDALEADGEKLRQMTGEEHGPLCPRCLVNPLGPKPIFLGSDGEGHICGSCWEQDRWRADGEPHA